MKKILLAVSAVALMFAGCTKDLTNEVVGSAAIERGAIVEKTLVFEDDTRLERDGVSGKLAWNEGDQIQVVLTGEDGALALDTQKYTVDHVNGKVGIPENTAYVLYMPVAPKISGTTASFNLPHNVTNLASAEAIFDQNPMKGVIEGDVIAFQNLLGYIKVPVKGEGKLQNVIVRTICRTSSDFHPIAQAATLDLSKNVSEDGGVKMGTNNAAYSYLKYTYKDGLDITNGENVFFTCDSDLDVLSFYIGSKVIDVVVCCTCINFGSFCVAFKNCVVFAIYGDFDYYRTVSTVACYYNTAYYNLVDICVNFCEVNNNCVYSTCSFE